ncbi:hypothetical protein NY547_15405 [Cnuibacter physcomitrellae]|uniref:SCO7613 C-terminal domain-containing membrane protein n=1 Tax=Cnuibacter physcomitrellae TaxID=1619308 RepID=UPI002175D306|nr:hypothetical protein [Cnuibacter physcomitrellae]MCS5498637.1 hypothetical protein [Cnuibacter physcomitrellae]
MAEPWTAETRHRLLDTSRCPRCGAPIQGRVGCEACGAVLGGAAGVSVWRSAVNASRALIEFEQALAVLSSPAPAPLDQTNPANTRPALDLPSAPPGRGGYVSLPVDAVPPSPRPDTVPVAVIADARAGAPASRPESPVSVQSVLAVAGAGLVAVAAIVFTFFNPDLRDEGLRSLIVGGVTVLFAGASLLLTRARLRFSAEAVGMLALVFVLIDVQSVAALGASIPEKWLLGAGSLAVVAALLLVAGARVGLRGWFGAGLIAATTAPVLAAAASSSPWIVAGGHLAAAAVALGGSAMLRRDRSGRLDRRPERVLLLALQLLWSSAAVLGALWAIGSTGSPLLCAVLAASAAIALASVRVAPRLWSAVFAADLVVSGALLPLVVAQDPDGDPSVLVAAVPLGALLACVLVSAALRLVPGTRAAAAAIAAAGVLTATALPALVFGLVLIMAVPFALLGDVVGFAPPQPIGTPLQIASLAGLAAATAAWASLGWALRRGHARLSRAWTTTAGWLFATALTILAALAVLPLGLRASVALGVALASSGAVLATTRVRPLPESLCAALATAAHLALLIAAAWVLLATGPLLALAVPVLLALVPVALLVPAHLRHLHVAVGLAFALLVTARLLALTGLESIAVLALTTCAASVVALAATLLQRVPTRWWYAVLVVTTVPFLAGVASVLAVRSGWTALSTTLILLLAVALVATPRAGLARAIRVGAAALVVPALAVIVICLGAQVLAISASPVTLPVIAAVVAVALPSAPALRRLLTRVPLSSADVRWCTNALEASSLLTAALAVLLALARTAAGFGTSALVLGILGVGLLVSARVTGRRYAAPLAGAAFAGALWSLLAMAEVGVLEAYTLPPALVATGIGLGLALRGADRRGLGLALTAGGLAAAVTPSLVLLAAGVGAGGPVRLGVLTAASVVALGAAALLWRRELHREVTAILAVTAMVTGSAPAMQSVRWGLGLDPSPAGSDPSAVMAVCAGVSLLSALLALAASMPLRRGVGPAGRRWLSAPALALLAVGPIAARGESWFAIGLLAALSLGVLALMVATAARLRDARPTALPPVWFQFLTAWCLAVASWSERELRVEAYSVPLGVALLAAGVLWLRRPATEGAPSASLDSWPARFTGSWALLTPGLVVLLLPSILATGTDPLTWRAILVIALAIGAVLVGSLRKLAAPFILGIVVLPIENAVVFLVQIGESISAAPWWITLATAGAVLLVIAVTSERRTGRDRGVAARLRDLA